MSPRTQNQFEKIRKEKRLLIMNTALELFATNGYEATSVSQIAKKAGISKGLLYNYFSSKEELIEAILNKGIDEMIELLDINKDGEIESHELEYFIEESFKIVRENRIFWKLYMSVSTQPAVFKFIEKKMDEMYEPMMKKMVNYFTSAGFENPLIETILFSSLLDGITLNYVFKPELFPMNELKKEIINRYCKKK